MDTHDRESIRKPHETYSRMKECLGRGIPGGCKDRLRSRPHGRRHRRAAGDVRVDFGGDTLWRGTAR